jgi:hypothetical protein
MSDHRHLVGTHNAYESYGAVRGEARVSLVGADVNPHHLSARLPIEQQHERVVEVRYQPVATALRLESTLEGLFAG